LKAAHALEASILARDVEAFMRLVGREGVLCIDDTVSRQKLRRDLRTPDSFWGAYFFAPELFKKKFANPLTPISLAEFLSTGRDIKIEISRPHPEIPCVTFSVSNIDVGHGFCFAREGSGWTLGDLLGCG